MEKQNKSELTNQRPAINCLLQIVQERKIIVQENVLLCKIIILSVLLQIYQCEIVDKHIYDEYLYKWLIFIEYCNLYAIFTTVL